MHLEVIHDEKLSFSDSFTKEAAEKGFEMLLSLRSRIILSYVILFIIQLVLSFYILWNSKKILDYKSEVQDTQNIISGLQGVLLNTIEIETAQRGYVLTGNNQFLDPLHSALSHLPRSISIINNMHMHAEDKFAWKEIKSLIEQKINHAQHIVELREKEGLQAALINIELGEGQRLMDQIRKRIGDINLRLREGLIKDYKNSLHSRKYKLLGIALGVIVTFILLTFANIVLIKSIYRPINDITKAATSMSNGDFTVKIPIYRNDEFGALSHTINSLSHKISNLINEEKKISGMLENLAFTSVYLGNSALSSSSDVTKVLQDIVDKVRILVQADYAALGIGTDPTHPFDPWVYSGLDKNYEEIIGRNPRPVGLLGWVALNGEQTRIDDLKMNPVFQGFPKGHPLMGPFIGVPISYQSKSIGNVYLTRKEGGSAFTEIDQKAVGLFASQVGVILENVKLQNELKKAVSSRQDVLAVVSHDLRSPLNIIGLSAEMLTKKVSGKPDLNWINSIITKIESASNKMKRMINDLLDISAIEAGNIQVNITPFKVHLLLEEIKVQFSPIVQAKNIDFQIERPKDVIAALGDADRIFQVFSNLIENAVKFTPSEGKIVVRGEVMNGRIQFSVSDTGIGIAEKDQKHLFEKYWQVEGTKAKGTGLGLYITKGIIDAHDSKLEVKSRIGKGTTFYFDLPLVS